jgi:iron(III) transport system substrate-binding protein
VRLLYNVIAVNTAKVKTPPQAWRELVKPEYAGLLAMPDPNFSGGALITLGTLVPRLSFEFFERLKASGMAVEQSNPVLQQKLARGEYGLAITTDFGLRQEAAKGAPLAAVYPKDGAILVPTPLAIPTWSKAPALAERFLNFLLSPEAQALFAERGYYPVMPGAPRPKGAPQAVLALSGMTASSGVLERFNSLFGLKR